MIIRKIVQNQMLVQIMSLVKSCHTMKGFVSMMTQGFGSPNPNRPISFPTMKVLIGIEKPIRTGIRRQFCTKEP
jgi:hypothetical protein